MRDMPDISALLELSFWKEVLYHSYDELFPDAKEKVGHVLSVCENCGDTLTFYIDTEKEKTICKSEVCPYHFINELEISC